MVQRGQSEKRSSNTKDEKKKCELCSLSLSIIMEGLLVFSMLKY